MSEVYYQIQEVGDCHCAIHADHFAEESTAVQRAEKLILESIARNGEIRVVYVRRYWRERGWNGSNVVKVLYRG